MHTHVHRNAHETLLVFSQRPHSPRHHHHHDNRPSTFMCPFRETLLKALQRISTHSLQPTTYFVLFERSTPKMTNSKAVYCSKAAPTATMQNAKSMQWLP